MNSATNTNPKILIAGAGPCGLVLALALRRSGISVRIIDKLPIPAIGQRGPGIMPRTQEILRSLGVFDEINKQAIPLPPLRPYVLPEGVVPIKTFAMAPPLDPSPACPYVNPLCIGQDHLEAILRQALQKYSCEVEFGSELVSLTQDADGVEATIVTHSGKEGTQRFEFLVGADGGRGVVRKQLGLSFLGESRPAIRLILGTFAQRESMKIIGTCGGRSKPIGKPSVGFTSCVYLRPTGVPGLFGLILALSDSTVDYEALMANRDSLQQAIATITGRADIKIVEVEYIRQWSPNIRMVDNFSVGRCFVAGDAAHVHSPTGGQGLNSSVQDSFNLAWKLALVLCGSAPMKLLDSYTAERLPVIQEMLAKTTGLLNGTISSVATGKDTSPWMRGGPLLMLGVNYRWSPIVVDEQEQGKERAATEPTDAYGTHCIGLRAGDRAPDATGLKDLHSGEFGVRLFDVLDATRHTVVVFSVDPAHCNAIVELISRYHEDTACCAVIIPSGARDTDLRIQVPHAILEDVQGHAYSSYGFEGGCDAAAVRPDGVLGAVVRGREGLERYFDHIFA
ncbi:FAD binding domain-containing protein [Mycena crocata]|nr:FAD binding domain-containing protein [Mycena crocata]